MLIHNHKNSWLLLLWVPCSQRNTPLQFGYKKALSFIRVECIRVQFGYESSALHPRRVCVLLGGGGCGELIKCGYAQSSVVSVWQEMWTWLCGPQETVKDFFARGSLVAGLLCSSDLVRAFFFLGTICAVRIRSCSCIFDIHVHHIPYQGTDDGTKSARV